MSPEEDRLHMARALELAQLGMYSTPPNPAVGCVLVRDGRVVGEGHHRRTGGPHAEVHALEASGEAARGATAYVSLEPCAHFGRTPPCTRALLSAGVARVVCAVLDPNPRVAGAGLEELARGGVAVESGLLASEAAELNRGYLRRMSRARPWVTLKIGASLDGRTALADGASRWITGEASRADVQRLRARASAIVTGIGTVLADDPLLTVRDPALDLLGRRPLRVVIDTRLRIPPGAKVLDASAPTIVFATSGDSGALEARGVRVEKLPERSGRVDLASLLDRLAALECNELLVEAGPGLAGGFLDCGPGRRARGLLRALRARRCRAPHVPIAGAPADGGAAGPSNAGGRSHRRGSAHRAEAAGRSALMFTGIIRGLGRLRSIESRGGDASLVVDTGTLSLTGVGTGDSIAVNGVCLTVTRLEAVAFAADVSRETLGLTTLGALSAGTFLNLETALRAGDALGGHYVSGHIDGVARVMLREDDARSVRIEFELPSGLERYVARKGSICIDGVSLTVNEIRDLRVGVNLVPHTLAATNADTWRPGSAVNCEVDMIARYLERLACP